MRLERGVCVTSVSEYVIVGGPGFPAKILLGPQELLGPSGY